MFAVIDAVGFVKAPARSNVSHDLIHRNVVKTAW